MTITRQDLEDAAKAAGIEYNENYGKGFWVGEFYSGKEWNPLTSKADLWDLADKCGMVVDFQLSEVLYGAERNDVRINKFPPHNHTECAEAVVLAAAEIWRAKK